MIYAHTQHGQAHAEKTSADTYNAILIRIEGIEASIINSPNVKAIFLNCGTIQKNKKGYTYTAEFNGVATSGECKTIKEAIAACVAAFIAIEAQCNSFVPTSAEIEAADADAQAAEQVAAEQAQNEHGAYCAMQYEEEEERACIERKHFNAQEQIQEYENDVQILQQMLELYEKCNTLVGLFYTDMRDEIESQIAYCNEGINTLRTWTKTPAKIVVGKADGTAQITTADGVTTVAPRRDVTISEVNAAHDELAKTTEYALIQSLMGRDYSERYRDAYAAYIATPQYKAWVSLLDAYNLQQPPADIADLLACEQARETHDAYFAQLAEQGEPPVSEEPKTRIFLILDGFRCRRRLIQHNARRERLTPLQWANNAVLAHQNGAGVLLHSRDFITPLFCYITRIVATQKSVRIELTQVITYQTEVADYRADKY